MARETFAGLSSDHFAGFREFRAAKTAAGRRPAEQAAPAAALPPALQFYAEATEARRVFAELLRRLRGRYRRRSVQTFAAADKADGPILQDLEEGCQLLQRLETRLKAAAEAPELESPALERLRQGMLAGLRQGLREMSLELRREEEAFLALRRRCEAGSSAFDLLNEPAPPAEVRDAPAGLLRAQSDVSLGAAQLRGIVDRTSRIASMVGYISGLAVEQGGLTDRIDHNLHTASQMTRKANKELVKAREKLERGFAARLIRLLVIANAIVFVLLLLKFK